MRFVNSRLLHFVLIIILVTTCRVLAINSPSILDYGSKEMFKEGTNLLLRCEGDEPLVWTHSIYPLDDTYCSYALLGNRHTATLNLEGLLVTDSGIFFCGYNDPKLVDYNDSIDVAVIKLVTQPKFAESAIISRSAKFVFFAVIITCGVLLVGLLIFCTCKCKYERKRPRHRKVLEDEDENLVKDALKAANLECKHCKLDKSRPFSVIDEVISSKWEFPRDRLKLGEEIGAGAFGRVVKAEAIGLLADEPSTTVAVKMIKPVADESQFNAMIVELKILANLGRHVNVVNFLGACTKDFDVNHELFLIVEYCKQGSLINYIRRHKDRFVEKVIRESVCSSIPEFTVKTSEPLIGSRRKPCDDTDLALTEEIHTTVTQADLLCWAFQIARGMEYLASRKVVHGDLAARNVLLTENSNVVKLCDFGLAKAIYSDSKYIRSTKNGKFPLRWMSIESIYYGELSAKSDCWSFGVVLWELFSLGKIPYSGIKADEGLIKRIDEGYRLEKPTHASYRVYNMMLECWAQDKDKRPTFSELVDRINHIMGEMLRTDYVEPDIQQYVCDNESEISSLLTDQTKRFSLGGHSYRKLNISEQDVDSCGYLKPKQVFKSTKPIQNADQDSQSQVEVQRQQQQHGCT